MEATEIRKVHCLFEQSGTFKQEFLKLGISAEDYDIQNNFNQTDHVVDLFAEIEKAYSALAGTEQNRTEQTHYSTLSTRVKTLCLRSSHVFIFVMQKRLYFRAWQSNRKPNHLSKSVQRISGTHKSENIFMNYC